MTFNPEPLQKQILDINLSGGVNERERPETANPQTTLTRLENLYQDQTGAYIKRYGTASIGNAIGATKLLRLKGGLGLIGATGALGNYYQYSEASGGFVNRDAVPSINVPGAVTVISSGPSVTPQMRAVASTSKLHAVMYAAGTASAGDQGVRVVVYDRYADAIIYKLSLSGTGPHKMVFVDDRYLHIYQSRAATAGGGLTLTVVDFNTTSFTTFGPTVVVSSASYVSLYDVDVTTNKSCVAYSTSSGGTMAFFNNAATLVNSSTPTVAAEFVTGLSIYQTSLWYVTNGSKIGVRSVANPATVVTAESGWANGSNFVAYGLSGASSVAFVNQLTAATFGGTTIPKLQLGVPSANGSIYGWEVASKPFLDPISFEVYAHLTKNNGLQAVSHTVVRIDASGLCTTVPSGAGNSMLSVRPAANLEPMLGVKNSDVLKYQIVGTREYCPAVPVQSTARGYSYCVFSCKPFFHSNVATQQFGGQNYMSGGTHAIIGTDRVQEVGFVDMPVINTAISATAGPTGSFKHIAVFRYVDESGAVTWSRTSVLGSTTTAAKGIDVVISAPHVTHRDDLGLTGTPQLQSVEVYRTKTGGTYYYLVGSSQTGTPVSGLATQPIAFGTAFYAFTDTMTDVTLGSQPALFRQPGTSGAAVDRYPPPSGNLICQHKDRLFTADPYGVRVYYSSFFVDGETAWFNPVFSFFVHGGSGPITGMVSMDGRLFVFKKDGIFVVDGDGPAEGGVAGNEFSPPQRLATEYGCVDPRTLVVSTDGIYYRSARGIENLSRSLQVKWVGERVQNTVDANPKNVGSVLDAFGRIHFCVAASDTGLPNQSGVSGAELVYDVPADAWTISFMPDQQGNAARCVQDIVQSDLVVNGVNYGETVIYLITSSVGATGSFSAVRASSALGTDQSIYVGWTVETAWIKTGQQARAKFSKVMLLAKKRDNHKITISAAFNYVDGYTQVGTFEPNVINAAAIEELQQNLNRQEVFAVRFLIQEAAPTNQVTYPVTTGFGADLLGISVEIAPKMGAIKVGSGQKV